MNEAASGGPRSRGNAILAFLVLVVLCTSLAAAVLLSSSGGTHEAEAALDAERAFQMAEAGVDWGIAEVRRAPATPLATQTVAACAAGAFTVEYVAGTANDRDDDGDGTVDEADERSCSILRSTGRSRGAERRIEVTLRTAASAADFGAAIQFNTARPRIDLGGNALTISGAEHFIDGTADKSRPAKPGIASPAGAAYLASQIPGKLADNVTGSGGLPSTAQIDAILTAPIAHQAAASAAVTLTPGTHHHESLGTPTAAGMRIVYCRGDLHLTGGADGAGLLVVDGDLEVGGGFSWVGVILVRGTLTFKGGGPSARLIGALVVDEPAGSGTGVTSVTVNGSVDVLYSSDAVGLATRGLAAVSLVAWREIGLR